MSEHKQCPACGEDVNINTEMTVYPVAGCSNPACFLYGLAFHVEKWDAPRPLDEELARRDDLIKRLKEDGERLVSSGLWLGKFLGMKDCIFCGMRAKRKAEIEHTRLCPITLHRALMKELEEK